MMAWKARRWGCTFIRGPVYSVYPNSAAKITAPVITTAAITFFIGSGPAPAAARVAASAGSPAAPPATSAVAEAVFLPFPALPWSNGFRRRIGELSEIPEAGAVSHVRIQQK